MRSQNQTTKLQWREFSFSSKELLRILPHDHVKQEWSVEVGPGGMMERVTGIVSKAFLPYTSDKFPIKGINNIDPNPTICNHLLIKFGFAEHNRMRRNLYHLKSLFLRNEKNRNNSTRTTSPIVYNSTLARTARSHFSVQVLHVKM